MGLFKSLGKAIKAATAPIRHAIFGSVSKQRRKINNQAREACARLEEVQENIRRETKHVRDDLIPQMQDTFRRNERAYQHTKEANYFEYISGVDQLIEAGRDNDVLAQMSAIANNQAPNADVMYQAMASSSRNLTRAWDKTKVTYTGQKIELENKMQAIQNAFDNEMWNANEAIKKGEAEIKDIDRRKARVWDEAKEMKNEITDRMTLNAIVTVGSALTGFMAAPAGIANGLFGAVKGLAISALPKMALLHGGGETGQFLGQFASNLLNQESGFNLSSLLNKSELSSSMMDTSGGMNTANAFMNGDQVKKMAIASGYVDEQSANKLSNDTLHDLGQRITNALRFDKSMYELDASNTKALSDIFANMRRA